MNKDNIHEYWHLLEALRDGKTLQYNCQPLNSDSTWTSMTHNIVFDSPPECYRIEPERIELWAIVSPRAGLARCYDNEAEAVDDCRTRPPDNRIVKLVEELPNDNT